MSLYMNYIKFLIAFYWFVYFISICWVFLSGKFIPRVRVTIMWNSRRNWNLKSFKFHQIFEVFILSLQVPRIQKHPLAFLVQYSNPNISCIETPHTFTWLRFLQKDVRCPIKYHIWQIWAKKRNVLQKHPTAFILHLSWDLVSIWGFLPDQARSFSHLFGWNTYADPKFWQDSSETCNLYGSEHSCTKVLKNV